MKLIGYAIELRWFHSILREWNRLSSRRGWVYGQKEDRADTGQALNAITRANVHANPYLDWISVRLLLDGWMVLSVGVRRPVENSACTVMEFIVPGDGRLFRVRLANKNAKRALNDRRNQYSKKRKVDGGILSEFCSTIVIGIENSYLQFDFRSAISVVGLYRFSNSLIPTFALQMYPNWVSISKVNFSWR